MKEQQAEDGDSSRLRRGCCFMCMWEGVGWDFFLLFLVARPGFGLGLRSTVCADLLSRCKVF